MNNIYYTPEYNDTLDGYVLTFDDGKIAQTQYREETDKLHADYNDRILERYTDFDDSLSEEQNKLVDEFVNGLLLNSIECDGYPEDDHTWAEVNFSVADQDYLVTVILEGTWDGDQAFWEDIDINLLSSGNPVQDEFLDDCLREAGKQLKEYYRKLPVPAPDYDDLMARGNIIDTALDGTCQLVELNQRKWVVLSDNTVISHYEDQESHEPIFQV